MKKISRDAKTGVKRIKVKNTKPLVDINIEGDAKDAVMAYGGCDEDMKGIVKVLWLDNLGIQ